MYSSLIFVVYRAILHSLGATDSIETDDGYALAKSYEESEQIERSAEVLEEEERLRSEAAGRGPFLAEASDDELSDLEDQEEGSDNDNDKDANDNQSEDNDNGKNQGARATRLTIQVNAESATLAKAKLRVLSAVQKVILLPPLFA